MESLRYASPCAILCALAIAAHGKGALSQTVARVTIDNFTFKPATLSVHAGTTVTFTNDDDIPHSVVASDGGFRSKALDTGDSFSVSFAKPGDFGYFCGLHPHMQGRIIVTP